MASTISYDSSYDRTGGLQNPAGGFISATFDAAVQNMGIADIWQGLSIPAGMMVHDVGVIVLTVEDSTCTLDVGITGETADGFLDGIDLEVLGTGAAGAYCSSSDGSEYKGGRYFATADTIDFKFVAAADTVKFIAYAHVSKPRV